MKNFIRRHRLTFSLLLTIIFSLYSFGCKIYHRKEVSVNEAISLKDKSMVFYVLDASQPQKNVWKVKAEIAYPNGLEGTLIRLTEKEAKEVQQFKNERDINAHLKNILLYAPPAYTQTLSDTIHTTIPFKEVQRIEVYEKDEGASTVATVFVVIGVTVLVFFIIVLIALATKKSCPFVYADNPDGVVFEGEIYSGATFPQLERHDWLPLPQLRPSGDEYRLRLSNQAKEIQYTNLLELVVADHPPGATVLFDKYGQLHTMTDLQTPVKATDLGQRDVLEKISAEDTNYFTGDPDNQSLNAEDGLLLTFARPVGAQHSKLVIRAKNSFWLDHVHGLFLDEQGVYATQIREKYMQKNADELRRWSLEQNIPLSVWLERAPGRWERIDYFNLPGPMALKRDVLPLDLSQLQGNEVRIKLSTGYLFWEIDYAALDWSADQTVSTYTLPVVTAVDREGRDQTAALRADDGLYYTQPNVGDEALVTFQAPPAVPGTQRTLLLHAKGHYHILHEPTAGKPGRRYLRQFREPNTFPRFSRDKWREMMRREQIQFVQQQ